jgi:hypothetical protein
MHNYIKKIAILSLEGELPVAGKVDYDVWHDDWCQIYRLGECNCDPEISFKEVTPENRDRIVAETVKDLAEFRQDVINKMN